MVHVDEGAARMRGTGRMCPAVDEGMDMHRHECGHVQGCLGAQHVMDEGSGMCKDTWDMAEGEGKV